MPIPATCGNCGKSYQAPDSLAGRRVRCKECGGVFEVARPEMTLDDPPDISAIEGILGQDDTASGSPLGGGTRGPAPRRSGAEVFRARPADVEAEEIATPGVAVRPNYRFKYTGSKEVDQFLPYALILGAIGLLAVQLINSVVVDANGVPQTNTVLGLSRYVLVLLCYFAAVVPCVAAAMRISGKTVGYQLPAKPFMRAAAAFCPGLVMTVALWNSSGDLGGFMMGLFVGGMLSLVALWLLFRLFPNELPLTGVIALTGFGGGVALSAGVMFVLNLVAYSLVSATNLQTYVPASPIARDMPWVEKKPVKAEEAVAAAPAVGPQAPVSPSAVTPMVSTPAEALLRSILARLEGAPSSVPKIDPGWRLYGRPVLSVDAPLAAFVAAPIDGGFDVIIRPLPSGHGAAVFRGDTVELLSFTDTKTILLRGPHGVTLPGSLAIAPDGARQAKIATTYARGILVEDAAGQASEPKRQFVELSSTAPVASLLGFIDSNRLVVRVEPTEPNEVSFDLFRLNQSTARGAARTSLRADEQSFLVIEDNKAIVMLPQGSGIVAAGRDPSSNGVPVIGTWNWGATTPTRRFVLPSGGNFAIKPTGLAANLAGDRVAATFDTGNYVTLFLCDGTVPSEPRVRAVVLGTRAELSATSWEDHYPAVVWIDERTLLVFGRRLLDATNGRTIAQIDLPREAGSIAGTLPSLGPVVPYVLTDNGRRSLAFAVLNTEAIQKLREKP